MSFHRVAGDAMRAIQSALATLAVSAQAPLIKPVQLAGTNLRRAHKAIASARRELFNHEEDEARREVLIALETEAAIREADRSIHTMRALPSKLESAGYSELSGRLTQLFERWRALVEWFTRIPELPSAEMVELRFVEMEMERLDLLVMEVRGKCGTAQRELRECVHRAGVLESERDESQQVIRNLTSRRWKMRTAAKRGMDIVRGALEAR